MSRKNIKRKPFQTPNPLDKGTNIQLKNRCWISLENKFDFPPLLFIKFNLEICYKSTACNWIVRFELRISWLRSNHSAYYASTTTHRYFMIISRRWICFYNMDPSLYCDCDHKCRCLCADIINHSRSFLFYLVLEVSLRVKNGHLDRPGIFIMVAGISWNLERVG